MKKLKRYELEAFDKMLVDKYRKLEQEYKKISNHHSVLEAKIQKQQEIIKELQEKVVNFNSDVKNTETYQTLKKNNKELKNRIKTLEKLRNRLIYELSIKYPKDEDEQD